MRISCVAPACEKGDRRVSPRISYSGSEKEDSECSLCA